MARKKVVEGYGNKPVVHDHFDGSAHCVECGGHCTLTGSDMAYTALVRALFEVDAMGYPLAYYAEAQLTRAGVNVLNFRQRAKLRRPDAPRAASEGG